MEKYRGHLLNWYDTRSLRSLEPRYVSTVDSGNLAGNLLVVKRACNELVQPPDAARIVAGLTDTLLLLREIQATARAGPVQDSGFLQALTQIQEKLTTIEACGFAADAAFEQLEQQAVALTQLLAGSELTAVHAAIDSLRHCILSHRRDIDMQGGRDWTGVFICTRKCTKTNRRPVFILLRRYN
jgi:cyclic beta-1,2-glucan synthetase